MWAQVKPVQIPTFSGNKRYYPSWKAAFMACVDWAPVTSEYKMLQLRQYVSGEVLIAIENLGFSPAAYETAKDLWKESIGTCAARKPVLRKTWSSSSRYSPVTLRSWNDSQTCWI